MNIAKFKNKISNTPLEAKASLAYMVCSVLQKGISLITLPLFTRLLTVDQFGQSTVYNSWLGIVSIFLTLNLAYGSFSTAMVKFEDRRDEYIASVEGICLLLSAVFLAIYIPLEKYLNVVFELPLLLMVVMVIEILSTTSLQFWSGRQRFELKYKNVIAVSLASSIVVPVVALVLILNTEEKGYAKIIGSAIGISIFGLFFLFRNIIVGKRIFSKEMWKYAIGFNVPLLVYYLSQVVFNQSDRIMIKHYTGEANAAIYGVAYTLSMILSFVLSAINSSYVPWFYGRLKDGAPRENRFISSGISVIMAVLLLLVIWFAPEIILVLAGKKYAEAALIVPPVAICLLLLFYSQLFINVEFYYEEKKKLVSASIIAALLNVILNALLIPKMGYIVAGYTTLISYIVFAFSNYLAMKNVLKERDIKDEAYSYKALLIILAVFTVLSFLGLALYSMLLVRIAIVIFVLIIAFIFREKLIAMTKQIVGKIRSKG